eukprot:5293243-Pyramimonas_sp.AAC.1
MADKQIDREWPGVGFQIPALRPELQFQDASFDPQHANATFSGAADPKSFIAKCTGTSSTT